MVEKVEGKNVDKVAREDIDKLNEYKAAEDLYKKTCLMSQAKKKTT